ncbi:glycosyltransferase family 4 protein [Parachitinimonas caeni]|uniref:Glycosyltransferase family 4 protein n=1 Tax=Parachitinimonas caeni TaxID=3031301 RepID=A0ABT7DRU6_9NEIS|nr:glycosyltransferase family 4 protein [Parachitinimonas caeni]MDK2122790.1 glycosyltransferase family 4 protein [Parachitinimonas caeni]
MKILFVTREQKADRRYGLGKSILPVLETLAARGHATGYLCQEDLAEATLASWRRWHGRMQPVLRWLNSATNLYALSWCILERVAMGRLAVQHARAASYSHVHCHDPLIGLGFWLFSSRASRPVWGVTEHGHGSYTQAMHEDGLPMTARIGRWMRRLEAFVLRRADWVISPTPAGRDALARDLCEYPLAPHWHVVPHARPVIQFYSRDKARQCLGWDAQTLYVVSVGRLVPLKQFPLVIETCAQVRAPQPLHLVILGEGDAAALYRHAELAGLAAMTITATDDIGLYLAAADVYISLTQTESFGLANLEALVAGLPAICTAVAGVPDVVGAGAMLIPPRPAAARQALQSLLDDADERHRLAACARTHAAQFPDLHEVTTCYESIYQQARPSHQ